MKSPTISTLLVVAATVSASMGFSLGPECDQVYFTRSGTFSSPSYLSTNDTHESNVCKWRIMAAPEEKIIFNVTNLDIEKTVNCSSAYLEVRDGFWPNSPLIRRLCGEGQLNAITSTTNKLLVTYYNAANVQKRQGFLANYEAVCGRDIFVQEPIDLQSPNHPERYPLDKKCIWRVMVPENHKVVLKFQSFRLEKHSNCLYDYLEIRDGFTHDSNLIGIFCNEIPPEIISSTNSLWIKFVSDASNHNQGFSATVMDEYDECSMSHDCAQECINIMGGYQCSCRPGFELHSNGRDCEDSCGGTLEGPNGTITSPSYPYPYLSNKTCIWEIVTEPQKRILLNFTHFDLNGINSRKRRCNVDRVEIFSKFPDGSVNRHGVYCGNQLPEAISSEGNAMVVKFKAGRGAVKSGFAIDFITGGSKCAVNNGNCRHGCEETPFSAKCVCSSDYILQNNGRDCIHDCHHEISSFSGNIVIPQSLEDYCQWLFTSTPGHRIQINFTTDQTRRFCQSYNVQFYSGSSRQSEQLSQICDSNRRLTVTSSRNELLLTIVSKSRDYDYGDDPEYYTATYDSLCGGNLYASTEEKYIYSHTTYETAEYPSLADCEWVVEPHPTQITNLTFLTFDLEDTEDCDYDYVEIFKLVDLDYVSLGRYCGGTIPPPTTWNNTLLIRFRSDADFAGKGFSLTYKSLNASLV